jgi:hypothetical protein
MDQLSRLADLRKQQIEESKMSRNEKNKDRFKNICKKKFQTCFIFPIAEFEEEFGEGLWGMGLEDNELTNEQKLNKLKWNKLRKNILDKGNAQLRAFLSEIELYRIEYEGYKTSFTGVK